jgi:benzoyl-CoA reductase/2-hydroxyglutaryl-CoA dehydratase subunit BcrC/BadD/HgdB
MEVKYRRLESVKRVSEVQAQSYADRRQAQQQGKKVAFVAGNPTLHLPLRAMDIAFRYGDSFAATASAKHKQEPLMTASYQKGLPLESCGYGKNILGASWMPEEQRGGEPTYEPFKPDFVAGIDSGCSVGMGWMMATRRWFKVPGYFMVQPYLWSKNDEKEAVRELTEQFRGYISFIEDMTHAPFSWERLRQLLANLKEAITLRVNAQDLAGRAIPSPTTTWDWGSALGVVNYGAGTPLCTDVYQQINEEVKTKMRNREGALEPERCRLYLMGFVPWPNLGELARMLAKLGANVVAAFYTHNCFIDHPDKIDPEKPLESLAANSLFPLGWNIEPLTELIVQTCQDYSIDGLVCSHLHTCYPASSFYFEIAEAVSRKLGIPSMYFEGDVGDPSFFSPVRAQSQFETLVESIVSRKKV